MPFASFLAFDPRLRVVASKAFRNDGAPLSRTTSSNAPSSVGSSILFRPKQQAFTDAARCQGDERWDWWKQKRVDLAREPWQRMARAAVRVKDA
eukprot:scaffold587_cov339-Pavlova_lutheri.AAC.36